MLTTCWKYCVEALGRISLYLDWIQENTDLKKLRFHVVKSSQSLLSGQENLNICSEFLCESASQAKKKFPFTVFSLLHKCSHFKGTVLFTRCWSLNFAAFLTCESDNDHPKGTEQSTPRLQAQLLHPLIQLL